MLAADIVFVKQFVDAAVLEMVLGVEAWFVCVVDMALAAFVDSMAIYGGIHETCAMSEKNASKKGRCKSSRIVWLVEKNVMNVNGMKKCKKWEWKGKRSTRKQGFPLDRVSVMVKTRE